VRIGGRLAFADGFGLGGGAARALADPFALASARALATVLYVARDAATWREAARSLVEETRDPAPDEDGVRFDHAQRDHVGEPFASAISTPPAVRAGATLLPGLLVARWLGPDAAEVRRALGRFVRSFRAQVLRRPLPALWHV
jgi:urease accessory protein UreH